MSWKRVKDLLPLAGTLFVAWIAYLGTVHATKANLEHERLSAAYAAYVASVAENVSGGDLRSVIEARGLITLYGKADVVKDLAKFDNYGSRVCEGDWFWKVTNRMRSHIGESGLKSEHALAVLCGGDPLTVRFDGEPTEHNNSSFEFIVQFSEPFPLSYLTLRDSAFDVQNGHVARAERVDSVSNTRWRITVKPNPDSDVTITLPKDRDCDAPGAICTALGKRLSNSPSAAVPHRGPSP